MAREEAVMRRALSQLRPLWTGGPPAAPHHLGRAGQHCVRRGAAPRRQEVEEDLLAHVELARKVASRLQRRAHAWQAHEAVAARHAGVLQGGACRARAAGPPEAVRARGASAVTRPHRTLVGRLRPLQPLGTGQAARPPAPRLEAPHGAAGARGVPRRGRHGGVRPHGDRPRPAQLALGCAGGSRKTPRGARPAAVGGGASARQGLREPTRGAAPAGDRGAEALHEVAGRVHHPLAGRAGGLLRHPAGPDAWVGAEPGARRVAVCPPLGRIDRQHLEDLRLGQREGLQQLGRRRSRLRL
mmetsp:Transcript_43448/g.135910  ORF Transcript_43448/g.135910 Transcript_43448/m.135910 type:complete len:299 (+) Transcript_43448:2411-3307(+)